MDRIAFFNGNQAYIFDRGKYNQYCEKNSVYATRFASQQMLIDKLQQRIDKAIEHIKDKTKIIPLEEGGGLELSDYDIRDLLEILRGNNNE